MASKKKLIEMDTAHEDWLKRTSRELELYEKDIIYHVFENAIKTNVMETYKSSVLSTDLLDQLTKRVNEIESIKQKAQELLKQASRGTRGR